MEAFQTTTVQYDFSDVNRSERLAKVTEKREALEEQMEKGEITEGVYLARMNALRDEYNGVRPVVSVGLPHRERLLRHPGAPDETDSMWFNGNRPVLSDRSWAHDVHRAPVPFDEEPPDNEIPEVD